MRSISKPAKILWRERGFAKASLLYADGKFILADENGVLALTTVNRQSVKVLATAEILTPNALTIPTLTGSTLYVSDRHKITALSLSGK